MHADRIARWRRHVGRWIAGADAVPRAVPSAPAAPTEPFRPAVYVRDAPSQQTAADVFRGEWTTRLPGVQAGILPLMNDDRLAWEVEQLGGVRGKRVLELGPLEGAHSWMLEKRFGAAEVVAVEANPRAWLRCLVVKDLLDLQSCRFLLGDFTAFLRATTERFDVIVANGVLYHMTNPVELLDLAAAHTDRLALWTVYYDAERLAARPELAFLPDRPFKWAGYRHALHELRYTVRNQQFCGGPEDQAMWLSRADLLGALRYFGFSRVTVGCDAPDHSPGPALAVAACRE